MSKKMKLLFIVLSMAVCFIPLIAMTVRPTTMTTENRAMASFPGITKRDGAVNLDFFSDFEKYFNDHFAFRNELVYVDGRIQGDIFQVSAVDNVIKGTDGWLYYKSTLPDYLGSRVMSEREIYNLAHNIRLIQQYVEGRGKDFLLTIPPNKNTLYGDNMPYYDSVKVSGLHNADLLLPWLSDEGIHYADLFALFSDQKEVLYLKRDSHWNMKGALLAYNAMMDEMGYSHDDYGDREVVRSISEDGDLNRMLYTLYGKKEANYRYGIEPKFSYGEGFKSVEDGWITASGGDGNGSLLMFRDSFGNTLIPFFADQFRESWYTKEMPYGLEKLMDEHNPDAVIAEKVERNIGDFITMPPIITAPLANTGTPEGEIEGSSDIQIGSLEFDFNYYKIYGSVDESLLERETDIIIRIAGVPHEAYHIGVSEYVCYIRKEDVASFPLTVGLELKNGNEVSELNKKAFDEGDCK